MKKQLFILILVSLWVFNQAQQQNDKLFKQKSEEHENKFKEEFVKPITLLPDQLTRTKEEVEKELSVVHENKNPLAKTSSIGTWDCVGPYYYFSNTTPSRPISYRTTGRIKNIQYQGSNRVVLTSNGGIWSNSFASTWTKLSNNLTCNIGAFSVIKGSSTYLVAGTGIDLNAGGGYTDTRGTGVYYTSAVSPISWIHAIMLPTTPSYINSIVCDTSFYDVAFDATHGNKMYCGTSNGLYYSNDQGRTWNQDPATASKFVTKLYLNTNGQLYYSVRGEGLYRKTIFTNVVSPSSFISNLPSTSNPYSHVELGFNPNDANTFYALVYNSNSDFSTLLKTTNNALSFIPCSIYDSNIGVTSSTIHTQVHTNAVCVSPVDPNKVMLGGINLYKSSDGYNFVNCAIHHVDINDIEPVKGTDNFWVASDGGICGYNFFWNTISDSYNYLPIIESNKFDINKLTTEEPTMALGTQDNGVILKSPWYGNWYSNSQSFSDGQMPLVHPFSRDTMLISEGLALNNLSYSYNASNGPTNVFNIVSGATPGYFTTQLVAKNYAYPIKYYGLETRLDPITSIYYKQNLTSAWVNVATSSYHISNFCVSPGANSTIYYSTSGDFMHLNGFYTKAPTSSVFSFISRSFRGKLKTMYPHDGWLIYYKSGTSITSPPQIEFSTDYGFSFSTVATGGLPVEIQINDILINPYNSSHIYLATGKGVYLSTNFGATWDLIDNNMPLDAIIMQLDYVDYMSTLGYITVYASTYGNSVWKRDFTATTKPTKKDVDAASQTNITEITDYLTLEQPYLDQSNLLNLNYFVGKDQNIQINMYDATGKQVLTIKNGNVNMGNYNDKLDISQLAKGIYIVTLTGSEKTIRKKWIL